jgi:type IV secretory pathway VirB2 component (pilin)
MTQGLNALQSFFYGPFFKIGCLVGFCVAGVMLLLDDGQMGHLAKLVLRGILIIAFVLGAASFFTTPALPC